MPIVQSSLRPTGWQNFGPGVVGRYVDSTQAAKEAQKARMTSKRANSPAAGETWYDYLTKKGSNQSFATMPSYAELLNMGMAPGTAFIVNGQHFLWNGTAVQPADAEGKPIATLSEKYQAAFDEAKAVNEQRYGEQKEEFDRLEQEATGLLEGLGEQERADTAQRYRGEAGANRQWAIDHGLLGTSAFPTMQAGIAEQEDAELRRLNESLRRERYGAMTGIRGEKLAMMERRTDSYPDIGLMASLEQAQGQWGQPGGAAGMAQPRMNYGRTGTSTNNGLPVGDPGWNFGAVGTSQYGSAKPSTATAPSTAGGMFGSLWNPLTATPGYSYGNVEPTSPDMGGGMLTGGTPYGGGMGGNMAGMLPAVSGMAGSMTFSDTQSAARYGSQRFLNQPNAVTMAQQPFLLPR